MFISDVGFSGLDTAKGLAHFVSREVQVNQRTGTSYLLVDVLRRVHSPQSL